MAPDSGYLIMAFFLMLGVHLSPSSLEAVANMVKMVGAKPIYCDSAEVLEQTLKLSGASGLGW